VRGLARRPAFTAVAVLSLALGIGANTTIFTLIKAIFLQPLPVSEPSRLVSVYTILEGFPAFLPVSHLNYLDFRDQATSFTSLAASVPVSLSLVRSGEPEPVAASLVSGNYFPMLGVQPALGRFFLPEEDGAPGAHPVAVLSYGLWQRRFGSDSGVIGRVVRLNGRPFTLVGVGPRGFRGTGTLSTVDLWLPLAMHDQTLDRRRRPFFDQRRATFLDLLGRLKPGVTVQSAGAEMKGLAAHLATEYPDANQKRTVALVPLTESTISPGSRDLYVRAGALLAAMVGTVLLIACANVANMLLVQAAGRRREIAVRIAIGSSRGRLVRQLLTESLLLALLGGGSGLFVAVGLRALATRLAAAYLPASLDFSFDLSVLVFTLALSLLTGLVFGLVPALQSSRPALVPALKSEAGVAAVPGRRFGLRNLLVVVQVALCLVALIGAALFLLSLRNAQKADPGFDREHLLTATFDLDAEGYDETRGLDFQKRLVDRVASLPGVRSAAVAENLLLVSDGLRRTLVLGEGERPPEGLIAAQTNAVSPDYFAALGIPILRGRSFTDQDRAGTTAVVVINDTMARKLWPGTSPLGHRFAMKPTNEVVEVVGVVADAKYNSLGEAPQLYLFRPIRQSYSASVTLHVRTERDPQALSSAVRREIHDLDAGLPVAQIATMSSVIDDLLWAPRAAAVLLAVFGALGLILACIGIYGVMSYSVTQRRREIGIRLALGEARSSIVRLFLARGMVQVATGLALGLLAAWLTARMIGALLFGVDARNVPAFAGTALLLGLVSLLATWLPARRATAVPPLIVMRQE
jgi:predicted permease